MTTTSWTMPLLAALLLCLLATDCPAQPRRLVVVYTDWFPYTVNEDGRASGFELEVFQVVAANMGLDAEYVAFPWKRCLKSLETGKADVLVSLLKTPEREVYTLFPDEHISRSDTVLAARKNDPVEYGGDLGRLKGLRIGVFLGFSYGQDFDRAAFLDTVDVVDTRTMLELLAKERIDLAADNRAVLQAQARRMGLSEQVRFLEPPIHRQNLYVGFSRANGLEPLSREFSRALTAFKQSGGYARILEGYGLDPGQMLP